MNAVPVKHYDVYWSGPYEYDPDNDVLLPEIHANHVLYMICGTHGLYGRNVPLYIGKTEQSIHTRISQHSWLSEEPDPVKIYTACMGEFVSWMTNFEVQEYPPLSTRIIEQVESLLIFAHQPVYNSRSKLGKNRYDSHVSIFNTGRRGTLYPEVSTLRWIGDEV
jgi:hypothetical protein